jgi:hypothetical protein
MEQAKQFLIVQKKVRIGIRITRVRRFPNRRLQGLSLADFDSVGE